MVKKCSFNFVIREQIDATPQHKEMSETLRGASNKRNAGFLLQCQAQLYIWAWGGIVVKAWRY
jgi:hypothetical protein